MGAQQSHKKNPRGLGDGDLAIDLEADADESCLEPQPDWETIAEVRELAATYVKKGATEDEIAELRQLADDAVPGDRPELAEELTRLIDAIRS